MGRFFLFIAILGLPLLLAACGGEPGGPSAETPAAGRVSIDFWHSEPAANLETLERMVARFNASQNEVSVRPIFQGTPEETMTKLLAGVRSGQVPAVAFLMETFIQRMIDGGVATPVQDFIDRENHDLADLDDKAVQYFTVRDKLWGMPMCVDMPLLYYNKTVFREVGLDPERPPGDLEELRQYSRQILRRDPSGQVTRAGIALDIKLWLEQVLAQNGDLLVDKANGREGRATKVLFDNETGRWFFQWWHDMVEEGLALNVGRNPQGIESFLAVAAGRAAMVFGWAGALRSVVDALEEIGPGIEVGVGAVPGPPGGTGASLLLGHGLWILNLRPEREQEAAWQFIRWLTQPEQQAEWFAGSGCLPVSTSAVDLPAARQVVAQYPLFQVALDLYLEAPAHPATLAALVGPFQQIRDAIEQGLEEMLVANRDPVEALDAAATNANQAIEEYNQRVRD